ncbi:MAG: uracil-DNA glycosylase family protein [Thiohalocapsa sp.]
MSAIQTDVYPAADPLVDLQAALRQCRACPRMFGPPVHGEPVPSPIFLLGQAPGTKEREQGRPFCWTAGRTLFRWFEDIGLDEQGFREQVHMSAVCRCFPGKKPRGGDRVPDRAEIDACARWWQREVALVRPRLIIAVGKLAIAQFLPVDRLDARVGECWALTAGPGAGADMIPLPHPSGASTWFKTEPGRTLLPRAMALIEAHPAWCGLLGLR